MKRPTRAISSHGSSSGREVVTGLEVLRSRSTTRSLPEVSVSTALASTPAAAGCTPKAWQAKNLLSALAPRLRLAGAEEGV